MLTCFNRCAMQKNYIIREATNDDVPHVFEMAKALAHMQDLLHRFCVTPASLMQMLNETPKTTYTIVVEQNKEILGFAMYTLIKNNRLYHNGYAMYIDELYVLEQARGQGIGKDLFKYIADIATQNNCNRLEWWVEKDNKPAHVFYNNLGARALDEFITYRLQDPQLTEFVDAP